LCPVQTRFHGLLFVTDPERAFGPEPTTEPLVDAALARLGDRPGRVADIGTGSGAIAITVALRAPHAEVWAGDTSLQALDLARLNASRLGAQVHVVHGDLLDGLPRDLDLIVANLSDPALDPGAPDGGGLDHYRRLLAGAADHLAEGGGVIIQLRGEILEAERSELPWLRSRLEPDATATD
jgi:release factor glutamine methyltransferase